MDACLGNAAVAERFSHICDGYKVDELDPEAIFNYQVENVPFHAKCISVGAL